jgi:hypothetical protein
MRRTPAPPYDTPRWIWTDRRARFLFLPVVILQMVYIVLGRPQHSTFWLGFTVYAYLSTGSYGVLRLREALRRRRERKALQARG